ncbi:MAG: hypothetical protein ACRDTC_09255 [Pseudonocardiaceae bacterium]
MDDYRDESGNHGRLSFLSRILGSAFELPVIVLTPGRARPPPLPRSRAAMRVFADPRESGLLIGSGRLGWGCAAMAGVPVLDG